MRSSLFLKCKSKNYLDLDNLSMYLVQQTINFIAKPLAYIFNMSFKTSKYLSKMKLAKIIPIFKNGEK